MNIYRLKLLIFCQFLSIFYHSSPCALLVKSREKIQPIIEQTKNSINPLVNKAKQAISQKVSEKIDPLLPLFRNQRLPYETDRGLFLKKLFALDHLASLTHPLYKGNLDVSLIVLTARVINIAYIANSIK